jgi:hypothetical protein
MTDFISDADSPEGFVYRKAPREVRLAPTAEDIKRMNEPAQETKLFIMGDYIPPELRGREPPEPPSLAPCTLQESCEAITKMLEQNAQVRREKMEAELREPAQSRILREMAEIQADLQRAKVAPVPEVIDEREEQTGPKTEQPPGGVRVADEGATRTGKRK